MQSKGSDSGFRVMSKLGPAGLDEWQRDFTAGAVLHGSFELLEAPGVGAALETPGVGVTTAGPAGAGPAGSGSAVAGDAPGAQSVALSAQDRVKDRELIAHMLLCVDSQFKELVAGAATAREAWVAIEQCLRVKHMQGRERRLPSGQALRHATKKEHSRMERRCMSTPRGSREWPKTWREQVT